jgi:tripartite-type tricarboxylate transporter receptor subunit TctC
MVGYAPGGGVDTTARMVAAALSDLWGSTVIVENRPGAAGNIANELTAKAPPDGYTLVLCNIGSHAVTPARFAGKLTYDPIADFAFPAKIGGVPNVLMVHPSMPTKTLQQYIAYAKAHPGKLNFGSSGVGGSPHLSIELLKTMTGIDIVHVPYKGGAPATIDTVAGQTSIFVAAFPTVAPQMRAGRLRALAVTTKRRAQIAPELPTVAEAALPGFESTQWWGAYGPLGLPAEIIGRLNADIGKVLATAELKQRLAADAAEPAGGSPRDLAEYLKADYERWGKVVRDAKIRAE